MSNCTICPRKCNLGRTELPGACGATDKMVVAKTMLHTWEEPIISGEKGQGSGAIFFSNCSLRCLYCQNFEISQTCKGQEVTPLTLAKRMEELEKRGAVNINLVTPTHYTYQILDALDIYRPNIPIVWNSSGYESVETIELLKNYVDVYMPDFKYFSKVLSSEYSAAPDYQEVAAKAILAMRKNQPKDVIENGIMKKGLLIRHLVLPRTYQDSILILNWIKEHLGTNTYISLMNQYTPTPAVSEHPVLQNKVKPIEYKVVVEHALNLGFENGFLQDTSSQTLDFTPDFG